MGGKSKNKIDKRLKELERIMSDYYRKLGKYELEYQNLMSKFDDHDLQLVYSYLKDMELDIVLKATVRILNFHYQVKNHLILKHQLILIYFVNQIIIV